MHCPNCGSRRVTTAPCYSLNEALYAGAVSLGAGLVVSIPKWIGSRLANDQTYCRDGCWCEGCRHKWIPFASPNRSLPGIVVGTPPVGALGGARG